ncbi:MAG TPA: archaeosortase/exosortase family protein [Chthonomonadaceae bacterium]|nr:archaeosortase/exosortase family protein [Chthonomonadaceae bacterium]
MKVIMDVPNAKNLPSLPDKAETEAQVASIWQFARYRLKTLWALPSVRLEAGIVSVLLLLLFAPALPGWWQRWTQIGSFQLYTVAVLPLVLLWIRLNRVRLVVPELDEITRNLQNLRATFRPQGDREDPDGSVLQALLEDQPPPAKRMLWPLLLGCLLTAFAYWVREPLLTCLAFLVVVAGILLYRHGTRMLRVTVFPLCFLLFLLPLPGMILDWINDRVQGLMFNSVLHVLLNANIETELAAEGNPLKINPKSPQGYELFATQAGLGLPEVWLVLMLTTWFLSLIRVPFRAKLGAVVGCIVLMGLLAVLRLLLLCWVGTIDREMMSLLEPLTRFLLVPLGIGGQILILRGFKCQKFQRWVSI